MKKNITTSHATVVVRWDIYRQTVPKKSKDKMEMLKRQQNSRQQQQQKQYPQLQTKLMQWQDNIMYRLVAGNATHKKIKRCEIMGPTG